MTETGRYVSTDSWTERVLSSDEHLGEIADVTVGADDRLYLLSRQPGRIRVYDAAGQLLQAWPEGLLSHRPHGITAGNDGMIYCADEASHTVLKFSPDGEVIWTIGVKGSPSETGADWSLSDFDGRVASIRQSGGPFNGPTKVAVAADGDLFVTDGYGNARVHHFSANGRLIESWGAPGAGRGQFHVPHSVCVAEDGRLLVADRENDRIQVFLPGGECVDVWDQFQRPADIAIDDSGCIYVSELRVHPGRFAWATGRRTETEGVARISILDPRGHVIERLGMDRQTFDVTFVSPHGLALDSVGNLYVAEVVATYKANRAGAEGDESHREDAIEETRPAVRKFTLT